MARKKFGEGLGDLFQSAGLPQQEPMEGGEDFPQETGVTTTFIPDAAPIQVDRMPWEMSEAELGGVTQRPEVQSVTTEKMPWEMTGEELKKSGVLDPAEIGVVLNEEQKGAAGKGRRVSGTRGQKPFFQLSDRSSLEGRAQRADVGIEGVSAAARFNARLAWGAVQDPAQELEIARRAIARDVGTDYPIENLRIGPATKQLEWVNPRTGKWDLFAGAGTSSFFQDVAAALPELREFGAEAAGGVAGATTLGAGGSVMGPWGAGAGTVMGNAAGTWAAAFYARQARLQEAKEKGILPDITDDQIYANAQEHANWSAGGAVGAHLALKLGSTIWRLARGNPAELLEAYKNSARLAEGKPLADSLESRAEAILGKDPTGAKRFGVSSGQQGALPELFDQGVAGELRARAAELPRDRAVDEVLRAENAARRVRAPGAAGLDDVYSTQQRTTDATDFAVFGTKSWAAEKEAGEILQRSIAGSKMQLEMAERRLIRGAEAQKNFAQDALEVMGGRNTGETVASMREVLGDAKTQLYRPFQEAYEKLEGASSKVVDMDAFRQAATKVRDTMGQDIVKSLDSTDIPAVKEAMQAGLTKPSFWRGFMIQINQPQSIGKVETLRKDLNEAIRQLDARVGPSAKGSQPGAPRARQVLIKLQEGLDEALQKSVTPEVYQDILNIRRGYATAVNKFDKGVIGKITEDEGFGAYKMSGNQATDFLLSDPENVRQFIRAAQSSDFYVPGQKGLVTKHQTDLTRSVQYAQEGVISKLVRDFKNQDTGVWDSKGLSGFLHKNAEALQELFGWKVGGRGQLVSAPRNVINNIAKDVTGWQRRADALSARLEKQAKLFDEKFGVFTGNPTTLARALVRDGAEDKLAAAMKEVRKTGGAAEVEKFRIGLASSVRRDISNPDGTLSLNKLDEFVNSERADLIGKSMGHNWTENVKTLRDMLKVRDLQATGMAPRDLANTFTLGVPGLRGISRFLRVPMPPMSPSGRGLTGFIGMVNDKTQRRLGEMLADPEMLQQFMNRARGPVLDPLTKAGKAQLTRFGMEHVADFWQQMKNLYGITADSIVQDDERRRMKNEPGYDERAQWSEYGQMGKDPTRLPGGETPGYGVMPEPPISKLGGPEDRTGDFARKQIMGQPFQPGMRTSAEGDIEYEFAPGVARSFGDTSGAERMAAEREEADEVERGLVKSGPHQAPTGRSMMKAGANDNYAPKDVDNVRRMLQDQIRAGTGNSPIAQTLKELLRQIESGGRKK